MAPTENIANVPHLTKNTPSVNLSLKSPTLGVRTLNALLHYT